MHEVIVSRTKSFLHTIPATPTYTTVHTRYSSIHYCDGACRPYIIHCSGIHQSEPQLLSAKTCHAGFGNGYCYEYLHHDSLKYTDVSSEDVRDTVDDKDPCDANVLLGG